MTKETEQDNPRLNNGLKIYKVMVVDEDRRRDHAVILLAADKEQAEANVLKVFEASNLKGPFSCWDVDELEPDTLGVLYIDWCPLC